VVNQLPNLVGADLCVCPSPSVEPLPQCRPELAEGPQIAATVPGRGNSTTAILSLSATEPPRPQRQQCRPELAEGPQIAATVQGRGNSTTAILSLSAAEPRHPELV